MSVFSKNEQKNADLGQTLTTLIGKMRTGELQIRKDLSANVMSMESLDALSSAATIEHGVDLQTELKTILGDANLATESLSEAQLEAGQIALMGAQNADKYHAKATSMNFSMEGANPFYPSAVGIGGAMDFSYEADAAMSMEAFENKDLNVVAAYSSVWNIGATRQDAAAELFYPTTVLTADHTHVDIKVPRTLLYRGVARNLSGDPSDFGFQNALEAYRNHKLLENETTTIIPHIQDDGSNAKHFVDPALVPPVMLKPDNVPNVTFKTAPYKFGSKFDVLAMSQHPQIHDGTPKETEHLDTKVVMSKLFMAITNKDSGEKSVVSWRTEHYQRSLFTKTVEGDFMEMQLTFTNDDLGIVADGLAHDGSKAKALAEIQAAGYDLRFQLEAFGRTNCQTGVTALNAAVPELVAVTKNGVRVDVADAAVAALLDNLSFELIGYELIARRTNSDRRTRGLLIDRNWKTDRFGIPLGAPISVVVPLSDDGDAQAMNDLINVTRIRNSLMAVSRLINYGADLKSFCEANKDAVAGQRISLQLEGIARYLVTPHYREINLDIFDELNTLKSQDRVVDINAVIVNCLRGAAYDAMVKSNYLPALQQYTNGSGEKPRLSIITDLNLPQYIMIQGDPRTVGIGMEFDIEASPDARLIDTIFMTFGRKSRQGPDIMSFGTHVWIPELVSVGQVHYQGSNVKQMMVQPRNQHIHQLPILIKVNVLNLEKALAEFNPIKTLEVKP